MDASTRDFVRRRAGNRCEYCHIPQEATPFIPFHVEHIVAKQHVLDTSDDPAGLAYACDRCNAYKGPNLSSIDPESGAGVDLFDPRAETWDDHFAIHDGRVDGRSPIGRATARLLNMNAVRRVELRHRWMEDSGEQ